jgi:hypothetical protein
VTGWRRIAAWAGSILGGLAVAGLGVFFVLTGLDRADKLASVIGVFVGLIGLTISVYGVVLARRGATASGRQTVAGSSIGGGVAQVRGVRGNVRIGPGSTMGAVPRGARRSPSAPGTAPAGQSVVDSAAAGPVRQVDDVGGDLDIDQ